MPEDFVQIDEEHVDITLFMTTLCIFFFEIFFPEAAPWFWGFVILQQSLYERLKVEEEEGIDPGEINIENVYMLI